MLSSRSRRFDGNRTHTVPQYRERNRKVEERVRVVSPRPAAGAGRRAGARALLRMREPSRN